MIYTPLICEALELCYQAHHNQFDKNGIPYVFHSHYVAMQMETEDEICTGLLQNILEDTPVFIEQIAKLGFSRRVLEALQLLYRPKTMSFDDYIARIKEDELAKKVKIAELEHSLLEFSDPKASQRKRELEQVKKAIQQLSQA